MSTATQFSDLGEVPSDWRHIEKRVTPRPGDDVVLPDGYLKWYDVHAPDVSIAAEVRNEAREFIQAAAATGDLELRRELGFATLHLSGGAHFLIVCVWRNINEMWQAAYVKPSGGTFAPARGETALQPTQCVWELGPTGHEREAWTRYLFSARDDAAKQVYLEDRLSGLV